MILSMIPVVTVVRIYYNSDKVGHEGWYYITILVPYCEERN